MYTVLPKKKSLLKHFRENEIDFMLLREETIINV